VGKEFKLTMSASNFFLRQFLDMTAELDILVSVFKSLKMFSVLGIKSLERMNMGTPFS
jgi:hypothetical protein